MPLPPKYAPGHRALFETLISTTDYIAFNIINMECTIFPEATGQKRFTLSADAETSRRKTVNTKRM